MQRSNSVIDQVTAEPDPTMSVRPPVLVPPSSAAYLTPGLANYVDGTLAGRQAFMAMHAKPGRVRGPGGPTDDAVPAMLSHGEYTVPTEVVDELGDGDNDAGADLLDSAVSEITGMSPVGSKEG